MSPVLDVLGLYRSFFIHWAQLENKTFQDKTACQSFSLNINSKAWQGRLFLCVITRLYWTEEQIMVG